MLFSTFIIHIMAKFLFLHLFHDVRCKVIYDLKQYEIMIALVLHFLNVSISFMPHAFNVISKRSIIEIIEN